MYKAVIQFLSLTFITLAAYCLYDYYTPKDPSIGKQWMEYYRHPVSYNYNARYVTPLEKINYTVKNMHFETNGNWAGSSSQHQSNRFLLFDGAHHFIGDVDSAGNGFIYVDTTTGTMYVISSMNGPNRPYFVRAPDHLHNNVMIPR